MRILVKSIRVSEGRRSAFLRLPRAEGNEFRCYSTGCGNLGHRSGDLAGLRHGEEGYRRANADVSLAALQSTKVSSSVTRQLTLSSLHER